MENQRILTVTSIAGEYATLADPTGEELFIALALLPAGVDVGSRLVVDGFDFVLVE